MNIKKICIDRSKCEKHYMCIKLGSPAGCWMFCKPRICGLGAIRGSFGARSGGVGARNPPTPSALGLESGARGCMDAVGKSFSVCIMCDPALTSPELDAGLVVFRNWVCAGTPVWRVMFLLKVVGIFTFGRTTITLGAAPTLLTGWAEDISVCGFMKGTWMPMQERAGNTALVGFAEVPRLVAAALTELLILRLALEVTTERELIFHSWLDAEVTNLPSPLPALTLPPPPTGGLLGSLLRAYIAEQSGMSDRLTNCQLDLSSWNCSNLNAYFVPSPVVVTPEGQLWPYRL